MGDVVYVVLCWTAPNEFWDIYGVFEHEPEWEQIRKIKDDGGFCDIICIRKKVHQRVQNRNDKRT